MAPPLTNSRHPATTQQPLSITSDRDVDPEVGSSDDQDEEPSVHPWYDSTILSTDVTDGGSRGFSTGAWKTFIYGYPTCCVYDMFGYHGSGS